MADDLAEILAHRDGRPGQAKKRSAPADDGDGRRDDDSRAADAEGGLEQIGFTTASVKREAEGKGGGKSQEDPPLTDEPDVHTVRLGVGMELLSRTFKYNDDLFGKLRPYDLPLAPAIAASVAWYPAAHFTRGWLADIGLVARFSYAVGLSSTTADSNTGLTNAAAPPAMQTRAWHFWAAARYRHSFGWLSLAGSLGFGAQTFAIGSPPQAGSTSVPEIPDVSYRYVRVGASARVPLPLRFALAAEGAYLGVVSTGEIGSSKFFPRASAGGIEVAGKLSYAPLAWLEVSGSATLRRYFYALNPEPGDSHVAGGALDQYVYFLFGVTYRYR